ncbi:MULTISPECIES: CAP domain-containing protein [unclassified Moraxella]|uniref:CAP domain-containing protein n=1 Tax=unclassified Moraxella TaxID=2685852 RepID=UPI003AF572EB
MTASIGFTLSPRSHLAMAVMTALTMTLTACGGGGGGSSSTPTPTPTPTPTSQPATTTQTTAEMQTASNAMVDLLNQQRSQCGFGSLKANAELGKSAMNHANYMAEVSRQNKTMFINHEESVKTGLVATGTTNPYFSGVLNTDRINTTGVKLQLAQPVNYQKMILSENMGVAQAITASDTKLNASTQAQAQLRKLLAAPYHMRGLVIPYLTEVGGAYQEAKWTSSSWYYTTSFIELMSASPSSYELASIDKVLTYPCDGVTGTAYSINHEEPNPLPNRDLKAFPIGQPTYVIAPADKTIVSAEASYQATNSNLPLTKVHTLLTANDPHPNIDSRLKPYEAIFIPDVALAPSTAYKVNYTLTFADKTQQTGQFSFTTQAKTAS